MTDTRRAQLMVDLRLQGMLLTRAVVYWLTFIICAVLFEACWIVLTDRPDSSGEMFARTWTNCGPALFGSLLLLPVIVLDSLRLSNRFTGPMLRLRRALNGMIDGENVPHVALRENDYWYAFAEDLNRLRLYIKELQPCRAADAEDLDEEQPNQPPQEYAETTTL